MSDATFKENTSLWFIWSFYDIDDILSLLINEYIFPYVITVPRFQEKK